MAKAIPLVSHHFAARLRVHLLRCLRIAAQALPGTVVRTMLTSSRENFITGLDLEELVLSGKLGVNQSGQKEAHGM